MASAAEIINYVYELTAILGRQFLTVISYPLMPDQRIHILYLATSLLLGILVYARSAAADHAKNENPNTSLLRFLFPPSVWSHSSAWLDIRYFLVHQMLRLSIYGGFMASVTAAVFHLVSTSLEKFLGPDFAIHPASLGVIELVFFLSLVLAIDFVAYVAHFLQHKIPLLWEFHKLHHSARVMHPLTNYREHPVDNIFYAVATGSCIGFFTGVISALIGYTPGLPSVFGVGAFTFAFNLMGYNLRHSHIWLRWPGKLSYLFGSPAHHQVHHSYHPEHIDKNFAFMFPLWDVMFKTYELPETNENIRFGLSENEKDEFTSCLKMYVLPVLNARKLLFATRGKPSPAKN
jgi:sterol desaturase/sphingolipid hydroxylase (fatty acid hydroxylase superfamily)